MLSGTLGGSKKYAQLANDTHRMIYTLFIPHTDAYGRLEVDSVTLQGRVLTRLALSPEQVEAALDDMEAVGLIRKWSVEGDTFAEIVDFHMHNVINLAREPQSVIPDCRGELPPERPPRGTKNAEASPLVHSRQYIADGVMAYEQACGTVLHKVAHSVTPETVEEKLSEEKRREVIGGAPSAPPKVMHNEKHTEQGAPPEGAAPKKLPPAITAYMQPKGTDQ